jgi:hypothetical protein
MQLCLARGVTSLPQMARSLPLPEAMVLLILFPVFYLVFAVTVIAFSQRWCWASSIGAPLDSGVRTARLTHA